MRKAFLLPTLILLLSEIAPIFAVEALTMTLEIAPTSVTDASSVEETVTTHLFILSGHPEATQTIESAPRAVLESGGTLRIADASMKTDSEEARQIVEKSLALSKATEKLWSTFRLDPNRKKQEEFQESFSVGKPLELPLRDLPVSITVTLLRISDTTPVYRIVFQHKGKTIADSNVEITRGGRAIVGAMDGVEAPYLFLFVEPEELRKKPLSESVQKDMGITAPRLLSQAPVFYPAGAKEDKIQGEVILELTIDTEGKIVELVILHSPDDRLSQAARESVSQWKYQPALTRDGKAVAVKASVTIKFALK
jgi:TonB family protein